MTSYNDGYAKRTSETITDVIDAILCGSDFDDEVDVREKVAYEMIDALYRMYADKDNLEDLQNRAENALGCIRVAAANATGWRGYGEFMCEFQPKGGDSDDRD